MFNHKENESDGDMLTLRFCLLFSCLLIVIGWDNNFIHKTKKRNPLRDEIIFTRQDNVPDLQTEYAYLIDQRAHETKSISDNELEIKRLDKSIQDMIDVPIRYKAVWKPTMAARRDELIAEVRNRNAILKKALRVDIIERTNRKNILLKKLNMTHRKIRILKDLQHGQR